MQPPPPAAPPPAASPPPSPGTLSARSERPLLHAVGLRVFTVAKAHLLSQGIPESELTALTLRRRCPELVFISVAIELLLKDFNRDRWFLAAAQNVMCDEIPKRDVIAGTRVLRIPYLNFMENPSSILSDPMCSLTETAVARGGTRFRSLIMTNVLPGEFKNVPAALGKFVTQCKYPQKIVFLDSLLNMAGIRVVQHPTGISFMKYLVKPESVVTVNALDYRAIIEDEAKGTAETARDKVEAELRAELVTLKRKRDDTDGLASSEAAAKQRKEMTQAMTKLQRELDETKERAKRLEHEKLALMDDRTKWRSSTRQAVTLAEECEKKMIELRAEVGVLETQKKGLEWTLSSFKQENAKLDRAVFRLQESLTAKEKRLRALEHENRQLMESVKQLSADRSYKRTITVTLLNRIGEDLNKAVDILLDKRTGHESRAAGMDGGDGGQRDAGNGPAAGGPDGGGGGPVRGNGPAVQQGDERGAGRSGPVDDQRPVERVQ